MTQNAEDFNRILNEINSKIDYMAAHNDRQAINAVLEQVKGLEKSFNDNFMSFNFEKQNIFDNIQREISGIIQKSAILKELFPNEDNSKIERIENTVNSGLSRVHNDLSDTIKQDFNQVAQGIGALYARIETLKNSIGDPKEFDAIKADINLLGNKMIEIHNELKQSSGEHLAAIIENINKNENNINSLRNDLDKNIDTVNQNIINSNNNLNKFKNSITNAIADTKNFDEVKNDINILGKKIVEIHNELKTTSTENLTTIIENINKNDNSLYDLNKNIDTVSQNIKNTNDNLNEFKNNVADNLINYLSSIKQLFVSFSDEMQTHQETLSSEIFTKKLQELDVISADIGKLSDNINLNEENIKSILNSKVQEVQNYLKTLEDMLSAMNINTGNSIAELTEIKNYIANTALKLDDINNSLAAEIQSGSKKSDELKEILSNKISGIDSKLYLMEDNLIKEIGSNASNMEQLKDNIHASVNENFNDVKAILECMRANVSQSSGNLIEKLDNTTDKMSSDINNFEEKLGDFADKNLINLAELKELTTARSEEIQKYLTDLQSVISSSSINLDNSLSEILEIKDYIANTSLKLDDINSNVIENIEKDSENLTDIKNTLEHRFETVTSKLFTMEDNLTKEIAGKISAFEQAKDEASAGVNNNINELKTIIECLRANILQSSSNITEKFNNFGNTLIEKLDDIQNNNSNSEELKEILNNVNSEIQKTQTQIAQIELPQQDPEVPTKLVEVKSALNELSKNSINISDKINTLGVEIIERMNGISAEHENNKQNTSEIKTLLDYVTDEMGKTNDKISNTILNTAKSKEEVLLGIEEVKNHISAIKTALADLNTETTDKINEKLFVIESKLIDNSETYEQNLSQLNTKLGEYIKNVELISEETNSKLADSAGEFVDIKSNLNEIQDKLTFLNTDQKSFFEDNITSIIEKIDEVTNHLTAHREEIKLDIKDVVRENITFVDKGLEYLKLTLDEIQSGQAENTADISNKLTNTLNDIKQELELVSTDINEIYQTRTDAIIKEFEPLKTAIVDLTSFDFNEVISDIKNQIELSYLNLLQELNKNLIENHDTYINIENTYKDVVARCASLQECIDDFSKNNLELINSTIAGLDLNVRSTLAKHDKFLDEWKIYSEKLEKKLTENSAEIEHSLLSVLDELQKTIDEKVKAGNAELKDCMAVMLNNEDLMIAVESVNSDISTQLDSIKSILSNKHQNIETSVAGIEKNITDKLNSIQLDLMDKPDEEEQINKFANLMKVALTDLQSALTKKLDVLASNDNSEIINEIVKLTDSLKELHSKADILAMEDDSDIREGIADISQKLHDTAELNNKISENINTLHQKVDILAMTDDNEIREGISDIQENISDIADKLNSTSDADSKISEMIDALHNKVDILAMADDSDLREEVADVKDLICEQKKLFENLENSQKAQEIDNYLQNLLNEINKIDLEKNTKDIKDAVMSAILSVTDQITFVEETEEIKDFVEEKTNVINQTLLDLKKQLNHIASSNSDMDLYSYTLQDVESDIAKLRLALNEISSSSANNEVGVISSNINRMAKSIEELRQTVTGTQSNEAKGDFGKLNEDILSISARTNKLLLNSDESYRILCDSMDEFNRKTDYLQEQLDIINSKNLDIRLEQIDKNVNTAMSSGKVLESVMMYLGEWMDGTTDVVNSIYDKASKTTSVQKAIDELKENLPEKQELLNIIEDKFEEQQSRIDRLEKKLEKAITMLEERNSDTVQEKIAGIETQLTKLSSNIEKLTSYVDE